VEETQEQNSQLVSQCHHTITVPQKLRMKMTRIKKLMTRKRTARAMENQMWTLNQKMIAALPFRYQKAFGSFRAAHERLDTLNESKRMRWRKTVRLQKEKGLSNPTN
jgi:hypothetical protein